MILSRKKTFIYSLIPAAVLLASLEGAARIWEHWHPPLPVDYGWGFDPDSRLYVPSDIVPGLMSTNPSKEVSFQRQQFALPKPGNLIRIFAVGGSSVNYASTALQKLALELTVQFKNRPCQVINAGGCAYGTHRLTAVVAEVMDYEPDLVMLFTGHNEFEEVEQMELARLTMLPLQKILYRSAACRFVRDRLAGLEMSRQRKNRAILRTAPVLDFGDNHTFTKQEIDGRMEQFRAYLTAIVEICRAHHVPLVIGTTPSNLWEPGLRQEGVLSHARALYDAGQYDAGMAYVREILRYSPRHQASDVENGIIREVAAANNVPLADVEAAIVAAEPHHVPGEKLFVDRCHFTPEGNDILAETFKGPIVRALQKITGH